MLNQNNFNSLARMSIEREKHEYVNEVEEEAYLIIEDELIPGGEIAKSNQERGKWLIFYIVSVTLTGIGIVLVSKNKI